MATDPDFEAAPEAEDDILEDDQSETEAADELRALQNEQDMPIEDLMKLYGYHEHVSNDGSIGKHKQSDVIGNSSAESMMHTSNSMSSLGSVNSNSAANSSRASSALSPDSTDDGDGIGIARLISCDVDDDDDDEDDDADYEPTSTKHIQVGSAHQADVPCSAMSTGIDCDDNSKRLGTLVWSPRPHSDAAVSTYLYHVACAHLPGLELPTSTSSTSGIPDCEDALCELLKARHNRTEALHALRSRREKPAATISPRDWPEKDRTAFEVGVRSYGKLFRSIRAQYLPHLKVSAVVDYYYHWKHSTRGRRYLHELVAERRRLAMELERQQKLQEQLAQLHDPSSAHYQHAAFTQGHPGGYPYHHHSPPSLSVRRSPTHISHVPEGLLRPSANQPFMPEDCMTRLMAELVSSPPHVPAQSVMNR